MEDIVIEEGKYIERLTKAKKRNPKARKRKIEQFKKDNYGKVFCEVCKEDDDVVLEVHHDKVEVFNMEDSHLTKLSDLRVLCSNCHRRVHGYKISVEELKNKLR
ncbi:MAG: HNH endonuclease [Clostridium sp.]